MPSALRPMPIGDTGGSIVNLREHNLSRILAALVSSGPLSRAELASRCGLGVTALTKLIADLRERDLVVEAAEVAAPGRGRPTSPIALAGHRWAVAGLMLDRRSIGMSVGTLDGTVLSFEELPVPDGTDGIEAYLPHLAAALERAVGICHAGGRQLLAVELGIAGAADSGAGEVVRSIVNGWSRFPLRDTVHGMLGALPRGVAGTVLVNLDRETNYAMLARIHRSGPEARERTVAYLGGRYAVSGGIFSRSTVEHGSSGLAGEFGHVVVDPTGRQCWCGRRGCVETRLGLAGLYERCSGREGYGSLAALAAKRGRMLDELLARADEGDSLVLSQLGEAGRWLGITVDTVAAVINPQDFIVDGYVARLRRYVELPARRQLDSIGALPSISALRLRFEDGSEQPLHRGMLLAAAQAVVAEPSIAAT
ncbi:ROK family protein [Arthrobacter sp. GCM10027362]|uniref:ROK family transcriptional regulator n=1 Tax=Arthrobacter sp. GCM10027362 TaxID=3273379 RepID=UPI00363E7DB2